MTADSGTWARCPLKVRSTLGLLITFLILVPASLASQDYFRFYAPPGAIYLNASLEREETVILPLTVEHLGAAVSQWFITASTGSSGLFSPRTAEQGSYSLDYQIYNEAPPSTNIISDVPAPLDASAVITSGDFSAYAGTVERVTFQAYFNVLPGQFSASGEYTDTITFTLNTGSYASPTAQDTVDIQVVLRMAELIDLYGDREPGNRYLDLTQDLTDHRIAMVNERSNSPLGYEVTLTSRNMANDGTAATPFFIHETDEDRLDYSLSYDGVPVGAWSGGTSLITDSGGITSPEWLIKELTLSYTGDPGLAYGEYEDVLTLTISAK